MARRSHCESLCRRAVIAALLLVAVTASNHAIAGGAQFGLNIDVNPGGGLPNVPAATYGAAAGQPGVWNLLIPSNAPYPTVNLLNIDGSSSGVTVRQTVGGGNTGVHCVGGLSQLDWRALMCDHAYNVAGVVNQIEYEFSNLPAGAYDLYTYACIPGEPFQPGFAIGVWVDNVSQGTTFVSGPVPTQAFEEGRTHDVRHITVDTGDKVRVRVFDTSGEFGDPTALNGFQIVKTGLTAQITEPDHIACVCDPTQIFGTAAGGGFSSYTLEWSATGNDPWNLITTSNTPVVNGLLGTWNGPELDEGHYSIRLTVQTGSGQSETAFVTVFRNMFFNPIDLRDPDEGSVYGGQVCLDGTVWDQCFDFYQAHYRQLPGGIAQHINPAMPMYTMSVINDPIAQWNSNSVVDGDYEIIVTGHDDCGHSDVATANIIIDNTLPTAEITDPMACDAYCSVFSIRGTASDANLDFWTLQYSGAGQQTWATIATGQNEVVNDVLAQWDTSALADCCYALRLLVYDKAVVNCGTARNVSETIVNIHIGNPLDANGDGEINGVDLANLLAIWGEACPDKE